jgi:alpha-glucosidase
MSETEHSTRDRFWTTEFESFYDPKTGFDIDGAWIDMNEPASVRRSRFPLSLFPVFSARLVGQFCVYPCDDPLAQAIADKLPPSRNTPPPASNAPILGEATVKPAKREASSHAGEDLLNPPYAINNTAGELSSRTVYVGPSFIDILTY